MMLIPMLIMKIALIMLIALILMMLMLILPVLGRELNKEQHELLQVT